MSNPLRWRGHEVSRIEGFSDTVFAFALTLLVVSLEVPHTYHELVAVMQGFLPFSCSFSLLIWIWHQHNLFFRRYGMQDAFTVTINAAILFVVLFYVYPLKFVFSVMFGAFGVLTIPDPEMNVRSVRVIFVIYGLGFAVLFTLFALLYRHAYRHRAALELAPLETFDARTAIRHHLVSVAVGIGATVVALLMPATIAGSAGFVYMLLGPAHAYTGWTSGRQRNALEQRLRSQAAAGL
jgi:uncharacterized membrane protein